MLAGLLFVTHTAGADGAASELTMIDLATGRQLAVAKGGTRGDAVTTTADGRVLVSQSRQVDVLTPRLAPSVVATNPPAGAVAALPLSLVTVTLDGDTFAGDPTDPGSVRNPANYVLHAATGADARVLGVTCDPATRTAFASVAGVRADEYTLAVAATVRSAAGVPTGAPYTTAFSTAADFAAVVRVDFTTSRLDRLHGTVSYDVRVTNTGDRDLVLPLLLVLDPADGYAGVPLGATGQTPDGKWLVSLAQIVPGGVVLGPGVSTTGRTITVRTPDGRRVEFATGVSAGVGANQPPVFTTPPETAAAAGSPYRYDAAATDPDGSPVFYLLVSAPPGMTVGGTSGAVTWSPTADPNGDPVTYGSPQLPAGTTLHPTTGLFERTVGFSQAGTYAVPVVATANGKSTTTTLLVVVLNANAAPTFDPVERWRVYEGQEVRFRAFALDPDNPGFRPPTRLADGTLACPGTTPTVTMTARQLPEGAEYDVATGIFRRTASFTQAGDYAVAFTATDDGGTGAPLTATLAVRVSAVPVVPAVHLDLTPGFPVLPNQEVAVRVSADAPGGVTGLTLFVNGQPQALDATGRVRLVATAPGRIELTAEATSVDGVVGHAAAVIRVKDPLDAAAPAVLLTALPGDGVVGGPTAIRGSVMDSNLDYWVLEVAPWGTDRFTELARGTAAVAGVVLATLDPDMLANGFHRVRLTAADMGERLAVTEVRVEVATAAKQQYTRQETDLAFTVGGATLGVVRAYDPLDAGTPGSFGPGWRWTLGDFQVATTIPADGREAFGVYEPARDGTRVYVTVPDGRRLGFAFAPERVDTGGGIAVYRPKWTPDGGNPFALDTVAAVLTKAGAKYYDLAAGQPYHPAGWFFDGPAYTLTAADGTRYELDGEGRASAVVVPGAGRVVVSGSAIIGPTGAVLAQFVRGAGGRVATLIGADGAALNYEYDAAGRLSRVLGAGGAERAAYAYGPAGKLTVAAAGGAAAVVPPSGGPGVPLAADLGGPAAFSGRPAAGTAEAVARQYLVHVTAADLAGTGEGKVILRVAVPPAARPRPRR